MRETHIHLERWRRHLAALVLGLSAALAAAACGTGTGAHLRVVLSASGGLTSEVETDNEVDESVPVGVGKSVYQVLLRVGSVRLETSGTTIAAETPVNVDLLTGTTLIEASTDASTLERVVLDVPRPTGEGVLRGESVSVFAAGVFGTTPFEYRDDAMEPITVATPSPLAGGELLVSLVFDMRRWFENVAGSELTPDGEDEYLLDHDGENAGAAQTIEEGIRGSVSGVVGRAPPCTACED